MHSVNYKFSPSNDPRLSEAVNLWKSFENTLTNTDKVGLIYHGDMDGLIGAAYTRRTILKHVDEKMLKVFWIGTEEYDFASLRHWVAEQRLNKCVFTDISIENHLSTLDFVSKTVIDKVFIFDHHVINEDIAKVDTKVIIANPTPAKLQKGVTPVPTFLFAYRLAKDNDFNFPDWLLLLAIFSEGVDSFFESETKLLLHNAFGIDVQGSVRQCYKNTSLPKISSFIRAAFSSPEKDNQALQLIDDVITGKIQTINQFRLELSKRFEPISKQISKNISEYVDIWKDKIAVELKDSPIILIPVDASHAVSGPVASILRGAYPEKVIITYIKYKDNIIFELRTSNDTHLNLAAILGRVASQIEVINYGGHPMASGALIKEAELKPFVEKLEQEILVDL
ncbi:MAG TPA: DHH family phosphoesterase [Pyrinomonadaceae bacterium]|jgi:single-stranded DNA-specific DHH superfamily exonuclease